MINIIYVISDIHGEYDKFIKMLNLIEFKPEDTMYILGDVIDRGKYSTRLLLYIMKQPNMKMLLGNHEEMLLQSLVNDDKGYYNCWMSNGGERTLKHFNGLCATQQREILDYLQRLPLTITISDFKENYLLVHAGVDFSALEKQNRETLLWARDEFIFDTNRFKETIVIFGHTPTSFMQPEIKPIKIWKQHSGKIGIDCGACFNDGRLGCLRLDDMKEFYI